MVSDGRRLHFFFMALFAAGVANADGEIATLDPTRPIHVVLPTHAESGEKSLQLQAIFAGAAGSRAVINGRPVVVGDVVDQAKVLAIGAGKVIYIRNGVKGEIVLLPTVLQPAEAGD